MQVTLVNDWWMSTDHYSNMGSSDTSNITDKQKHNATKIFNYFNELGWSLSAIAGILGNIQVESFFSPAAIQSTSRLPNQASSLSDVPNSVMIDYYGNNYGPGGKGIGLVQWDGNTPTNPPGQKLVSFAIRYELNWYDGDTQVFRIKRERETNIQWQSAQINNIRWTWDNYVTNTQTPEVSARVWQVCYESADPGTLTKRQQNARYWYNYFSDVPPVPPPDQWITGNAFAALATQYDPDITGVQIPYTEMDCIKYVQTVWRDIPSVSSTDVLSNPLGTNSLWRKNMPGYGTKTFPTVSPLDQNPTPVLWYKDTIANCIDDMGGIPSGALLFHQIGEDDNPQIPPEYRGDGIGNFAHVGIYIGNNQVMQSGGRDSSSVPGGGVHRSAYDSNAWNYVAFVVWVDPTDIPGPVPPGPDPPPEFDQYWLFMYYTNKKKGVTKNVWKAV